MKLSPAQKRLLIYLEQHKGHADYVATRLRFYHTTIVACVERDLVRIQKWTIELTELGQIIVKESKEERHDKQGMGRSA